MEFLTPFMIMQLCAIAGLSAGLLAAYLLRNSSFFHSRIVTAILLVLFVGAMGTAQISTVFAVKMTALSVLLFSVALGTRQGRRKAR